MKTFFFVREVLNFRNMEITYVFSYPKCQSSANHMPDGQE